jgi:GDPmannose 4,6-dehydratase
MKIALITGITGMDGSLLAELLLEKGYEVHGIIRRCSTFNTKNIDHIFNKLKLYHGDITDTSNIFHLINKIKPDEIYNLAAQSHVKVSNELENYTFQVNTIGVLNILQAVKELNLNSKVYQASTSEMYGNMTDGTTMLSEKSVMNPVSIYGISKKASQEICDMYRSAFGMFIVSGILFNHECERRGGTFVTQKIVQYVVDYSLNETKEPLQLGNLNARRDWGYARDYVKAIWLMLQQNKPENYVIATGETHSVREFVELAFKEIGVTITWEGEGLSEIGKNGNNIVIVINPKYYRDIDIECLIGNPEKAKSELKWKPTLTFPELVKMMVHSKKKLKFN